jgi:ABC-2 type transport system ATP-binding protein
VHFAGEPAAVTIPEVTVRQWRGRSVELAFDPRKVSAHRLIARVAAEYDVEDVHLDEPPIEEAIARFYAQHAVEA